MYLQTSNTKGGAHQSAPGRFIRPRRSGLLFVLLHGQQQAAVGLLQLRNHLLLSPLRLLQLRHARLEPLDKLFLHMHYEKIIKRRKKKDKSKERKNKEKKKKK